MAGGPVLVALFASATLFGPKFEMYLNQSMYKSELREEDFNFDDGAIKFLFMGKMDVKHA